MSVADDNIYCATDDSTSFWAVWELWILRLLPRTSYLMSFVFFLQIKRRTDQRTPQLRLTQLQTHPSHIQGPLYHPQHFSQHFNHCGFYTYVDNTGSSLTTARLFHRWSRLILPWRCCLDMCRYASYLRKYLPWIWWLAWSLEVVHNWLKWQERCLCFQFIKHFV